LAVGQRMPAWIDEGFIEYAKRMPREMPLALKELKPAQRSASAGDLPRWLATEAERIEAALPESALRVVLDEKGRSFPTRGLAVNLEQWRREGRDVAFIIGGADGLADGIRKSADLLWSLSPLTLPHGLVRVILAEQLYRAASLLTHHPYHRD
ncbi:MAG: 23S rRNA (pseudouridine(1915)-N(3))-methyltransferase RlmH, partial [Burkholderiales bacterium]|nr:23S rRNA (pseudouridine(1915)-N(3))-methyltransferase RlmH [Burkholderiales bacterium]